MVICSYCFLFPEMAKTRTNKRHSDKKETMALLMTKQV